jgi:hypothetical protein
VPANATPGAPYTRVRNHENAQLSLDKRRSRGILAFFPPQKVEV